MNNNKYLDEKDEFAASGGEDKFGVISKIDGDLFDDKKYIKQDLVGVRRLSLPRGGETWEILFNQKSVVTVPGIRFSKKERDFLRKPEGLVFLMNGYRAGWKAVSEFKRQIKKCTL